MTDFATQNLVNSGSAALPSFQEDLLRLQGLPHPPQESFRISLDFSRRIRYNYNNGTFCYGEHNICQKFNYRQGFRHS